MGGLNGSPTFLPSEVVIKVDGVGVAPAPALAPPLQGMPGMARHSVHLDGRSSRAKLIARLISQVGFLSLSEYTC